VYAILNKQSKQLNCDRLKHVLTHAANKRKERQMIGLLSSADLILSKWNEFTLLRIEFSKLYPSLKPDEIFDSDYNWVLNELTLQAEQRMLEDNINEIFLQTTKNKR